MCKGENKAITVLELLVVVTIVTCLVALTLPVLHSVRLAANEKTCLSNLRQLFHGIELYRNENDGIPYGSPSQMALPPFKILNSIVGTLQCPEKNSINCSTPNPYNVNWPVAEFSNLAEELEWAGLVQRRGEKTILLADFGHSGFCPLTGSSLNKGMGLLLGGSVLTRIKRADPSLINAFFDKP